MPPVGQLRVTFLKKCVGAGHVTSVLSPDWSIVQAQERDQGEDLRGDLGGWRQVSGVSARVLGRKI